MKSLFLFFLLLLLNSCVSQDTKLYSYSARKMGVDFRIDLYALNSEQAATAVTAAFTRIDEINRIMSDYLVDSELWQLSATSGKGIQQKVSSELWEVLTCARQINTLSAGAFDISAGPYVLLWRQARFTKKLPDARSMLKAANKVGMSKIKFNEVDKTVELTAAQMRLDLGGIAKGFATDEALKTLQQHDIKHAMVDGSGDISMASHPEGSWRVYISDFKEKSTTALSLSNCAVATSGDIYQHLEIGGHRYSHIVDPLTGLGVKDSYRVTVMAKDGKTADALASALTVMGPVRGLELIESLNAVEALMVKHQDGKAVFFKSSGFPEVSLK